MFRNTLCKISYNRKYLHTTSVLYKKKEGYTRFRCFEPHDKYDEYIKRRKNENNNNNGSIIGFIFGSLFAIEMGLQIGKLITGRD